MLCVAPPLRPLQVKGQGIYAFVTLMADISPSESLRKALKESVRSEVCGSRATISYHTNSTAHTARHCWPASCSVPPCLPGASRSCWGGGHCDVFTTTAHSLPYLCFTCQTCLCFSVRLVPLLHLTSFTGPLDFQRRAVAKSCVAF